MIIERLFFAIVNRGKANAVLKKAREHGVEEATIFFGEGMVQARLLEWLGLTEIQKEILMIPASRELSDKLYRMIDGERMFHKRNSGIAFSIPFQRCQLPIEQQQPDREPDIAPTHYCIITVVDKGRGRSCIKAARAAGARGGTLIHARGAGTPADFYVPLVIEPQKEVLMIVANRDKAPQIRNRMYADLELSKAGNGIIFMLPVVQAVGLVEDRWDKGKEAVS